MPRLRAAALILVLASTLLAGCGSDPAPPAAPAVPSAWPLPADVEAAMKSAGLPLLGREMLEVHYHAHVDLMIRGVRVMVPALIGIDVKSQRISPLHTHDTTGIIHIESEKDIPFTLGQLFAEWGQPLTASRIGPVPVGAGEKLRLYANGTEVTTDLAATKLKEHTEYYLWMGPTDTPPKDVPASFTFPNGL
jgi:hypothetical protein